MPKSLRKRKRGLQSYLGAVETLPCVLKINQTLNFPGAPFAIPNPRHAGATSSVPRAERVPSGSQHGASSAPKNTDNPREVPACRAVPAHGGSDGARGESKRDGEGKGTVPPCTHPRTGCRQLILYITAPATRVDVLFRSCLAFPENTNFSIDLCSFVIFITWPALLLKAVTNSTSPGWKGRAPLTLSGRALPTRSPLAGRRQKPPGARQGGRQD